MLTLSYSHYIFRFLRTVSFFKLWNYFLLRFGFYLSQIIRRPVQLGLPAFLSAEPTTVCNLKCPECPSGLRAFSRPTGTMDMPMFQQLIDEAHRHIFYLLVYFQGEPYLNPNFSQMVAYARKKRVFTATSTNGHYLTERYARLTVESGLDELIISLDGTDQDTYSRYRRGGDLNKVLDGIKTLVRVRKELGVHHPFINLQFIVMKQNEHQISEFRQLAAELGVDRAVIKTAQIYSEKDNNNILPDGSKYARYYRKADGSLSRSKPVRNRCWRMWNGAVVTWDGRMVPCCYDKDATYQMGRIGEVSLKSIWMGEAYRTFRAQILKNRSVYDICLNCGE
ncbi:MAG TPA: radical SAM protein [Bacteroidales bacterium]|nr:MAG: radical SAM protein [Bacteroidetes bacterium GWE2_42_24]OFY30282.1 MAG: radical SAM protein [Bacteroidetes bacterium GWF2_43_11]HAQ65654.1 radical SAM protein [Bacteroidales bacterium]HBZ68181.1 radical SAM protein [Bacteroidales bacterium]